MRNRIILVIAICILAFTVFMSVKTFQAYVRYREILRYEEKLRQEIDEILQEQEGRDGSASE